MKKLRIAIYPADQGGCGKYRISWPAAAAADHSKNIEILRVPDIKIRWNGRHVNGQVGEWDEVIDAYCTEDVDVMVFQRPLNKEMATAFKILKERGVAIVVDLDDNFDLIDPKNAAWFSSAPYWHNKAQVDAYIAKYGNVKIGMQSADGNWYYIPKYRGRTHRENIYESLRYADVLTASTGHIAQHYGRLPKESIVIENHIPQSYFEIAANTNGRDRTLGWTGTLATHPSDFRPVGAAIKLARAKTGFRWKIIGDGGGIESATGLAPDETTGWLDINGQYQQAFASLDAIVCPLDNQKFNMSKSWLKPLEAAALGVVPIMSPLPEYVAINEKGVGVVARRPREWESAISKVMSDSKYRLEIAKAGREFAKTMTIESNVHKWVQAWERAYELNKQ